MTTQYGKFALALALGLVLTGGAAQAQVLDVNTSGSGTGSVGAGAGSVDANTSVDADVSVDADTGTSDGDTTTGDATMGTSVSGSADASGDTGFSFMRRTLERATSEENIPVAVASDVSTSAGLRAYAESSIRNDDRIDGIVMADDGLSLTYRRDARFLGFIPSGMNVTVDVTNNGEVSVSYPWYSFLLATDESREELETRLRAELASLENSATVASTATVSANGSLNQEGTDASLTGSASASGSASMDSQRWARVIERIQASLSAEAEARAQAS